MITETRTRRLESGVTVYEITGRLNLGNFLLTIETAIKRLIDQGERKLILDITGVNFIDSSGIGMLAACAGHMDQANGQMRIAGAQGTVAKALQVVHMDRIADLDPTVEASESAFESQAGTAAP